MFIALFIAFEELSDAAFADGDMSNGVSLLGIAYIFGYLLCSSIYRDGKNDAKKN